MSYDVIGPVKSSGPYERWPSRSSYEKSMSGLGTDPMAPPPMVVPYTTSSGQTGQASVQVGAPECGSVFGTQAMLKALGYPVTVDGQRGPETNAALAAYAASKAIPFSPATGPDPLLCTAIAADYQLKLGAGSGSPSPGCPPGQYGWPPFCYGMPGTPGSPPPSSDPASACPPGSVSLWGQCVPWPFGGGGAPAPGTPAPATPPTCPPGTTGTPPNCVSAPVPAGMATGTKVLLVALGGVGVFALVAVAMAGRKRSGGASYAQNPKKKKRGKKRSTKKIRRAFLRHKHGGKLKRVAWKKRRQMTRAQARAAKFRGRLSR